MNENAASDFLSTSQLLNVWRIVPYWTAVLIAPLPLLGLYLGGLWVLAPLLATWVFTALIDKSVGLDLTNADPNTDRSLIRAYQRVTLIWAPLQAASLFGTLALIPFASHLGTLELIGLAIGLGTMTGTIGINFSHELMHVGRRFEKGLADVLLAMTLYSHFRSEHMLVHHRYVGTPRDPVTARKGETFYQFFPRVLKQCYASAFRAEALLLSRRNREWWYVSNPFWRYWGLQLFALGLAYSLAGWVGLAVFVGQAYVAISQLELVNYIEHYGLTRLYLGERRYEHVQPHHSWNAAQRASNWLLINLQRHSDHHHKPDRPFPLLQTHPETTAPQLPHGYPVMTLIALVPPLWKRTMDPRVQRWRGYHYPNITDWDVYNRHATPWPR